MPPAVAIGKMTSANTGTDSSKKVGTPNPSTTQGSRPSSSHRRRREFLARMRFVGSGFARGVLAPMLQVSGALAGRLPVPRSAVLLVEGGLLVGLLVSALAIPPLVTQHNGPANPSVVPQNYWANLGIFWALDALVVAAALVVVVRRRRGPRV